MALFGLFYSPVFSGIFAVLNFLSLASQTKKLSCRLLPNEKSILLVSHLTRVGEYCVLRLWHKNAQKP
jgi:hypothetical protein